MIAQMRGRKNESGAKTLAWMLLAALCSSAITAFLKGPHPLIAATVFQTVGITAACLYGAVIYRLQLAASRGSNLRPRSVSFSLFPFSFSISQHRMSPSFPHFFTLSIPKKKQSVNHKSSPDPIFSQFRIRLASGLKLLTLPIKRIDIVYMFY
jgi:hypothetical protein